MKTALIVIDLQNDYFCNGNMPLQDINIALQNTNELIHFARKKSYKIYFIQHFSIREGAAFFIPQTKGVELHCSLDRRDDIIIKKHYPNSFRDTPLKNELQKEKITRLIICGAMTHMCIDSTVRAGFDLGFHIVVASDACATKDLELNGKIVKAKDVHHAFLSALSNIFCDIQRTDQIIG
jgi:nicotinamidase-related amidase